MVEKFSPEDTQENTKELSQEREFEQHIKATKQQLVDLSSEVKNTRTQESHETDLYRDPYEGVDVEGNINPHVYYKEFIDFKHKTSELLSPNIMRINSIAQLMPMITDRSDTTYLVTIGANRCKPCMYTLPALNEFAQTAEIKKSKVGYLDTESAPGMVEYLRGALHEPELGTSYPTVIAVRGGEIADAHVGGYDQQTLEKMVTTI